MINQIIKDIRTQQDLAKKPLVEDSRTLNTQLGNIKRAEENLSSLFMDLRTEVQRNLVLILVKGSKAEEFAKVAQEEFACLAFPANSVYKKLSDNVDDMFLNKTSSPSIVDLAMGGMSDLAHEIGILGYNFPKFTSDDMVFLKDRKDLEKLVEKIFIREVGAELAVLSAIHDASKKIMETDFDGKKVPVILHSSDKTLIEALAKDANRVTSTVFTVTAPKEITKEAVEEKLIELSKKAAKGE